MEKGVISKSKRSPRERHKAKNLVPEKGSKPNQCGQAVKDIQARLPNARIVYASAIIIDMPHLNSIFSYSFSMLKIKIYFFVNSRSLHLIIYNENKKLF